MATTTLIHFPARGSKATVQTFSSIRKAELAARPLDGTVYVFGRVTSRGLEALTLGELNTLYNQGHPDLKEPVQFKRKRDVAQRVNAFITNLATPGQEHATKEDDMSDDTSTTDTKKSRKPKAKKESSSDTKKKPGRPSPLTGKKLIKTEKGEAAKRKEGTRRTNSYNAFRSGSLYETAISNGAHPDDLMILFRLKHIALDD